jgi:hypothetical protein
MNAKNNRQRHCFQPNALRDNNIDFPFEKKLQARMKTGAIKCGELASLPVVISHTQKY